MMQDMTTANNQKKKKMYTFFKKEQIHLCGSNNKGLLSTFRAN